MSTVTITLPPDTEKCLRDKATLIGQSLESFLQRLADRAASAANGGGRLGGAELTPDEWIAEWEELTANQPAIPVQVDDSRESIYAGRGE
jgi:hypothetical protein